MSAIVNLIKKKQLPRLSSIPPNAILNVYDPLTGKDYFVLYSDMVAAGTFPDWLIGTTYNTGDRVYYALRLWESKVDSNTGNTPKEDSNWTEVSATGVTSDLIRTEVPLSAAQIKGLYSARVDLLPAPGANKFNQVESVYISNKYGTVPFNFASQFFYLGFETVQKVSFDAVATFNNSYNTITYWGDLYADPINSSGVSLLNKAFSCWMQSSDAAAGDGTAKIIIYHKIVDLS